MVPPASKGLDRPTPHDPGKITQVLIFFVLVDGWTLVAGRLVQSYGT